MSHHLRIARPVRDLEQSKTMYCNGLNLVVLASFQNHDGFDGIMLGRAGMHYHFEFTYYKLHPITPVSSDEDLIVFYIPDPNEWQNTCSQMLTAGFQPVRSLNPYWDVNGRTFQDADGYRIILQNAEWVNSV